MTYQRIVISRFGAPEVLQLVQEPVLPEPGPGQVRVRVEAASVSFTDTMMRTGSYPEVWKKPPFTPGYDIVGRIDKLGAGVTDWQVGARVADLTVTGGYTQYLCLPASQLTRVPDALPAPQAAALVLSGLTAYQMVQRYAQVQAGQTVLVHAGSGAVGLVLIQLARLAGARVLATASAGKHDFVRALGAEPIDYQHSDFALRVHALTQGQGVDAAFDTISFDNFQRSFRCLKPQGVLVAYGAYASTIGLHQRRGMAVLWQVLRFFAARWRWRWQAPGKRARWYTITADRRARPQEYTEDLQALFALAAAGKVQHLVDRTLPLAAAAQAHALVERAIPRGKIVLLP